MCVCVCVCKERPPCVCVCVCACKEPPRVGVGVCLSASVWGDAPAALCSNPTRSSSDRVSAPIYTRVEKYEGGCVGQGD